MKKLLFILLLTSTGIFAQGPGMERLKAARAAMFTEALELSASEAEKFWPVYNAYDDKVNVVKKNERRMIRSIAESGGIDAVSEEEANKLIAQSVESRSKELELRKQLLNDLNGVLSNKKILKLFQAEEDFKKRLLNMMRRRKGNR